MRFLCQRMHVAIGMLLDAFTDIPSQVEAGTRGIFFFEDFDDPEALCVMIEAPLSLHEAVQFLLSGVTAGGVPEIMGQRDGFCEIFIETKGPGEGAADGGDLDGVGEARAVMVPGAIEEDLGFPIEPPECGGMDDPRPVPLDFRAKGMLPLAVPPSSGSLNGDRTG